MEPVAQKKRARVQDMKQRLEQHEEWKRARTVVTSDLDDGLEDDEYIAVVRAQLAQGKRFASPWVDGRFYNGCLARKKCDHILEKFDKLLDPFEMYYGAVSGMPSRVWANMVHDFPPCLMRIIEDTCSAFAAFSDWDLERGHGGPPADWRTNRQAIEDGWPLRQKLMDHLGERMEDFICNGSPCEVVEWYEAQAARRWRRARLLHVNARSIVKHWVHVANEPGSAGHQSGIRFIQERML